MPRRKGSPILTRESVLAALEAEGGIRMDAARRLKIHVRTLYRFITAEGLMPEIERLTPIWHDALADEAEAGLRKLVRDGHPTAIIFTLKTVGKRRGYQQTMEHTGRDGGPMEHRHDFVQMTPEQIRALREVAGYEDGEE